MHEPDRREERREVRPAPVANLAEHRRPHPAPAAGVVAELSRITTLHPRTYNEARTIGENFREGVPVIMNLSEMDDAETARAAIAAAETGHLVISSMRTTDPADTIDRIVSFFPEPQQRIIRGQLASQLLAILSQRLLDSAAHGKSLACEVLTNNERVQEWIIGGAEPSVLIDVMKESEFFGMQTMDAALLRLVVDRSIELPAAIPFARNVHEMRAKAMAAGIQL